LFLIFNPRKSLRAFEQKGRQMKLLKRAFPLVRLPILFAGAALAASALLFSGCIADTGSSSQPEAKAEDNSGGNTLATAAAVLPVIPPLCPGPTLKYYDDHIRYWDGIAYYAKRQISSTTDPNRRRQLMATIQNANGSLRYWREQKLNWALDHRCRY
jgi:hypothetical protein